MSKAHPSLSENVKKYLDFLCLELPTRQVGSPGNQAATEFLAKKLAGFGFRTICPEFQCIDWITEGANLTIEKEGFEVYSSPYSLGCVASGELVVLNSVEELENIQQPAPHPSHLPRGERGRRGRQILLVRGELAKEQLMPKNFPFYNPPEHQHIIRRLENFGPQAIVAATSRNPEMAGAVYPSPLIEDGDFDIPSVYMTEAEGTRLAGQAGKTVSLVSRARRFPSKGCIVTARKGAARRLRIVVCAHIDTKIGTPGALDNAGGVVVLLLLAELLERYTGKLGVEIFVVNGEDYYAASGEKLYLQENRGKLDQILLNVNLDAAGYIHGETAYSLYDCPEGLMPVIHKVFASQTGIVEGEQWYQSDHMVFVQNRVPALAVTSHKIGEILTGIAHTDADRPELVDPDKLVNIALALEQLVIDLDRRIS
jgi:aminopeptidase YwaD